MNLQEFFRHTVIKEQLFTRGERIVVAVSGGPDSTALLHLLFLLSGEWDLKLTAAHANHGFRPEESRREAAFIRETAEGWGIPFVYKELDLPEYLERNGGNPQDEARKLRYRFLTETAMESGSSKIALAHHADDQAETVLMRVLRGTGIGGLSGISIRRAEKNVELIRPLLRIYKSEILSYLAEAGIGFCTDSSNEQTKYERNRIRLEALPYLSRFNPALPESLNRLADLAHGDDDFLERETGRLAERLVRFESGTARLSRKDFTALHVALQRRLIKLILNYLFEDKDSWDFTGTELIRSALLRNDRPNLRLDGPGKVRIIREYDEVRFTLDGAGEDAVPFCYRIDGDEGELFVKETPCRLKYETVLSKPEDGHTRPASALEASFDYDSLKFPLYVRSRRDGDRIRIEGLNGSKKVKDIFIDAKISPGMRNRMPLLTDAEGALLWIPGIRRSDHARVTSRTSRVFCIREFPSD